MSGRLPTSRELDVIKIVWMCRHAEQYTDIEFVERAWEFTRDHTPEISKLGELRQALPPETVLVISNAAARALRAFSPDALGIYWRGADWRGESAEVIPMSFFAALGECPPDNLDAPREPNQPTEPTAKAAAHQ